MIGDTRADPARRTIRREAGFELSVSRAGVRFRRFAYTHQELLGGWPEPGTAAPVARRRRIGWGAVALLASGSVAAGVLAAPARFVEPRYSVLLAVPDAPARQVHAALQGTTRKHRAPAHAAGRPPVPTRVDDGEEHFIGAAMDTGELQSWHAGNARHFLVAGDLQPGADGACRQFSLLTRLDGGGDTVRQFERCRLADPGVR